MTKIRNSEKGFGIVEVLISAMLIVLIAGSAMSLSREIIKRNLVASQRVTAFNLAREYLEIARNARDTAVIDGTISTSGWDYYFNPNGDCVGDVECIFSNSSGKWQAQSGKETKTVDNVEYTRIFRLYAVPNQSLDQFKLYADPLNQYSSGSFSNQIWQIKVIISWNGVNTLDAETILTNWSPEV